MKNKRVDFHIKNQDYFGNLATAIDLIRQSAEVAATWRLNSDVKYRYDPRDFSKWRLLKF